MCGIVGFITKEVGKNAVDRQQFMRDGLIMDTLRGADATGIFMVPHAWTAATEQHQKVAYVTKKAVPGHTFVTSADYSKDLYPIRDWRAVVGHNRAATRGKRNDANAHPFQEGPVTMVHNGTLTTTYGLPTDQWDLNKGRSKDDEVTVDSHVLCHNLAEASPEEAEEIISKVRGAFALVWSDARDESVNIVRNSERPLHLAYGKDDDTLFFMSESEMLYALTRRGGIKIGNIFYPKPGIWMKWLPDTPLKSPIVKEVELAKAYSYQSSGRGRFRTGYDTDDDTEYTRWAYGGYYQNTAGEVRTETATKVETAPKVGVTPPGKRQAVSERDNRVLLLGRRREVPDIHQDNLLLYGLLVDDRLPFLPHVPRLNTLESETAPTPVRAEGCLYGGDAGSYSAVVYNVPNHVYQNSLKTKIHERRMWTVRPVAVKWERNARYIEEPVIICHLVRPTYQQGVDDVNPLNHEPVKLAAGSIVDGQVKYNGPAALPVTADEFMFLVRDGCAVCNLPLGLMDSDTIEWVDEHPICSDCQDIEEESEYA